MTFFPVEIEPHKDPALLGWASRLHRVLVEFRRCSPSNLAPWVDEFRRLRKRQDDADIEAVLRWFERYATDKYTPAVFSAKSFCSKFAQIKEAMVRQQAGPVRTIQVSDDAWSISRNAGGLIWPGEEKGQELQSIQLLLDDARRFLRRMYELEAKGDNDSGLARYIAQVFPGPMNLASHRLLALHRMAWEWSGWTGNLEKCMRLRHGDWFRRLLLGWIQEYRGSGKHVELVEELLGESS